MVLRHLQYEYHFVRSVRLVAVLLRKNVHLLSPQIPTLRKIQLHLFQFQIQVEVNYQCPLNQSLYLTHPHL